VTAIDNEAWRASDRVAAQRKRLLAAGYLPIPCAGKRPAMPAWQNTRATDDDIRAWRQYRDAQNTGILTRTTPAVDIDVVDAVVADELQRFVFEKIGKFGAGMVRFGAAPKRAIVFRTGSPFAKLFTPIFVSPDGRNHRVEVLCDGQQIVVHGTHPDTGDTYFWQGGEPGEVKRDQLPELSADMAAWLVEEAAALMKNHGWIVARGNAAAPQLVSAPLNFEAYYGNRQQKYAAAALEGCTAELAGTAEGGRNDRLNALGFRLGTMVSRGWIARDDVFGSLKKAALKCGLSEPEIHRTLNSALDAGAKEPHRDIDDRAPGGTANDGVSIDDFFAYMPMHSYIYAPSREMWPATSVNARLPLVPISPTKSVRASRWLDQNKPVEQMTWAPGLPMLVCDRLISEGGWIERNGVSCFNLYRPPMVEPGNAAEADPWIDHVRKIFGEDADHILKWLAHRVQCPDEKINHALVLGGNQGIGKDTLLEPVKRTVGPWNFSEVSPQHMLGRFNGFVKSVILRVSEARDLGDVNRFQFYDHMKAYIAAPPDVLRVDEKNLREHNVFNCVGVIITTNHKTDGIFLPADDRRHFVAWSSLSKDNFDPNYWSTLWTWYRNGGTRQVAAYLTKLDLASFDPKAPPPKTPAFWDIVDANRAPEDAELADVLDRLGNPDATTLSRITIQSDGEFEEWITDRKNRRVIPHRLEKCGYVQVRNDAAADGLWKINGRRQAIYAKNTLLVARQLKAARELASD
jgi:Family of unknown function (DUF5906)/Bifunctional DNA primase/polymerase, N-terminal